MSLKTGITLLYVFFIFKNGIAQNTELSMLQNINVERNKKLDPLMVGFSNSVSVVSIGTPMCLYIAGVLHKNKLLKQNAIQQSVGLVFNAAVSTGLKYIIQRPRPYITHPQLTPYYIEGQYAMPSSHTSFSFYTATINTLQFKNWYVALPMYLWASTCAYSRMHLGVHYPSDVLAGAALGAGSAWLTYKANKWLFKKK